MKFLYKYFHFSYYLLANSSLCNFLDKQLILGQKETGHQREIYLEIEENSPLWQT